jgi:GT2 family glycosyltransferase
MKLAIIILSGDTPDILFKCLRGVRANVLVEYKIYLAYNGKSAEIEAQIRHFFKCHFPPEHYKIVKYDFYNFAILNNDIVRNHLDAGTEYLLFCNNDVVVTGECVNEMVYLMSTSREPLGTIGCRLLFENGRIQHDGQMVYVWSDFSLRGLTHINLGSNPDEIIYPDTRRVLGNTFALCLCKLHLFQLVGGLNEEYQVCLEDVEFNLSCLQKGYKNVILPSNLYAHHFESFSRKQTAEKGGVTAVDSAVFRRFFNGSFMNGKDLVVLTKEKQTNRANP